MVYLETASIWTEDLLAPELLEGIASSPLELVINKPESVDLARQSCIAGYGELLRNLANGRSIQSLIYLLYCTIVAQTLSQYSWSL
jgi:hypothetical protein